MTEMKCHYPGDRQQAIVSYLYGDDADFDRAERAGFEAHLASCSLCRDEVAAFDDVRGSLAQWSPPILQALDRPGFGPAQHPGADVETIPAPRWNTLRTMPVWAQAAAALLFVGVAAGMANLDVRYDAGGLRVRTGWMSPADDADGAAAVRASEETLRTELAAVEQRLRAELTPAQPANVAAAAANAAPVNQEVIRRVRALVDDSERRQQRELALRLGEAMRDVNAQRQADLVRIDQNMGAIQNTTGREMMRQRSEMLNYFAVRTSLQRPQ